MNNYDDDDDEGRSLDGGGDEVPLTTGNNQRERAEAQAEVAAMDGTARNNNNANRAAQEAVMGVVANDGAGGAEGFEVTDESGRLVQQRFVTFLGTL